MGSLCSREKRRRREEQYKTHVSPELPGGSDAAQPRLFVGANWKCSLQTAGEVDALVDSLNAVWRAEGAALSSINLCVFPPYVFADRVRQRLRKELQVGSQNVWDALPPLGVNTGAVTAKMLHSLGCSWVLLGHSDRRNTLGEGDDLIAAKVGACFAAGLRVNLTIGETAVARDAGEAISTLLGQLGAAAAEVPDDAWGRVVVAYEPVWAIGEGATPCSPEETQRVHAALRGWLREQRGEAAATACRFVYTGSVNERNAEQYAGLPDVDGFVVGRAGLDATKLLSVCRALARLKGPRAGPLSEAT